MLARKLDNAVWQEQQQYTIEEVQIRQQQREADRHKLLRRRVMVVATVVLATYMYSVWRSSDVVHYGNEIIALQTQLSLESNLREVGKTVEVLVEGFSKRSKEDMYGRTSQYKTVVFPREGRHIGELVKVEIMEASAATLKGKIAK